MTTTRIPITLNGETREVPFITIGDGFKLVSHPVFAARIGNGAKMNRASATAWKFDTIADARQRGYQTIVAIDGQVWAIQMADVIRNRQARIAGWADEFEGTNAGAKHNAYNAL